MAGTHPDGRDIRIRAETDADRAAVKAVNESAFETTAEANLAVALNAQARPVISLVADDRGTIIGHIMFSPVLLPGFPERKVMGLGPMAVLPEHQRKGAGSRLVHAGLDECRKLGFGAVVVLGHPDYYPRFGFRPAARFGLRCEYEVPEEAFMVLEIQPRYLDGASGTVKYHAAFHNL